jgi:hypothetical protein
MPTLSRCLLLALPFTLALTVSRAASAGASPPVYERFTVHTEAGVGTMFPEHQRMQLGYDGANFQGTAHLAFTVLPGFAVQASAASWWFPAERGSGRLLSYTVGLRAEPRIQRGAFLVFDLNAGLGLTGALQRFTFDVGVGFTVDLASWLSVGPMLRYGHVVQDPDSDYPQHAQFWSGGAVVSWRWPRRRDSVDPRAPVTPLRPSSADADRDGDGVIDAVDQCPDEPAGRHRDLRRLGCPLRDRDQDGVTDNQDQCPDTPRGLQPDPNRPGCPDPDSDGDGVGDHYDECAGVHAGFFATAEQRGCPLPDRDGDAIPDAFDRCPTRPGSPHPDPERHGCPGLVRLSPDALRLEGPIEFAPDGDRLDSRSERLLEAVAQALAAVPEIRRLTVRVPHRLGRDRAASIELAAARGQSLIQWLTLRGVERTRLEVQVVEVGAEAGVQWRIETRAAHEP